MRSQLPKRIIHFTNLPIKLLMPSSFTNITEIAIKTIPSATKIEIKRIMESLYGFDVEKVHTLNMEGKKKRVGNILFAKPDYKKAYVMLKTPLSISPDVFPIKAIEEDKAAAIKKSRTSIVSDGEKKMSHWLEDYNAMPEGKPYGRRGPGREDTRVLPRIRRGSGEETTRFPWSRMRSINSASK